MRLLALQIRILLIKLSSRLKITTFSTCVHRRRVTNMVAPHLEKLLNWSARPSAYSALCVSVLLIFLEKILLVIGVKLEMHRPPTHPLVLRFITL